MRKMIVVLALASVAAPALAEPEGRDGWLERRAERAEQRQERSAEPARAESARAEPQRVEPQRVEPQRVEPQRIEQPRVDMGARMSGENRGGWQRSAPDAARVDAVRPEAPRGGRNGGGFSHPDGTTQVTRQAPDPEAIARWRERIAQRAGGEGPDARQVRTAPGGATRWGDHVRTPGTTNGGSTRPIEPRPIETPTARTGQRDGDHRWDGNRDGQRWSNDWRRDPRYDWQRYRDRNRFVFRIGNYYDPFGWGYRRPNIGFTLYVGYYQPDYWLDDPWQYRLPPVYGPYRWVRYYDDAVLVDIYSGHIVDVIRNFFW